MSTRPSPSPSFFAATSSPIPCAIVSSVRTTAARRPVFCFAASAGVRGFRGLGAGSGSITAPRAFSAAVFSRSISTRGRDRSTPSVVVRSARLPFLTKGFFVTIRRPSLSQISSAPAMPERHARTATANISRRMGPPSRSRTVLFYTWRRAARRSRLRVGQGQYELLRHTLERNPAGLVRIPPDRPRAGHGAGRRRVEERGKFERGQGPVAPRESMLGLHGPREFQGPRGPEPPAHLEFLDRKSTRLKSSHAHIS